MVPFLKKVFGIHAELGGRQLGDLKEGSTW